MLTEFVVFAEGLVVLRLGSVVTRAKRLTSYNVSLARINLPTYALSLTHKIWIVFANGLCDL
jgi:hypothetical protein